MFIFLRPELDSFGAFFRNSFFLGCFMVLRPAEEIHEGLLGSEGSQRCALLENFMDLGQASTQFSK